MIGYTYTCKL